MDLIRDLHAINELAARAYGVRPQSATSACGDVFSAPAQRTHTAMRRPNPRLNGDDPCLLPCPRASAVTCFLRSLHLLSGEGTRA